MTSSRGTSLAAVGPDEPRGLRRQAEEGADRVAGACAGGELEHLAQEHQRDDHGGGLEVDRDVAVSRNDAGKIPGATVATTL